MSSSAPVGTRGINGAELSRKRDEEMMKLFILTNFSLAKDKQYLATSYRFSLVIDVNLSNPKSVWDMIMYITCAF